VFNLRWRSRRLRISYSHHIFDEWRAYAAGVESDRGVEGNSVPRLQPMVAVSGLVCEVKNSNSRVWVL
jgi:hypothetical protein